MSDITPISRAAYLTSPNGASRRPQADPTQQSGQRASDRVELSSAAQFLSKLRQLPDVRQGLVDQVRSEIQAGTYETDAKLDTAIDNLAQDLP